MNQAEIERALLEGVGDVLAEMAFCWSEPLPTEGPVDPLEAAAEVSFGGTLEGRLAVAVFGEALDEISAGILGEDRPPPLLVQEDALRELANVVCGAVLHRLEVPEGELNTGLPRIVRKLRREPPRARAVLGVSGGAVEVCLYLTEATA